MTQNDILDLLKSNSDKWYSSLDLQNHFNTRRSTIQVLLKKIRKWKLSEFKKEVVKSKGITYLYKSHTGNKK